MIIVCIIDFGHTIGVNHTQGAAVYVYQHPISVLMYRYVASSKMYDTIKTTYLHQIRCTATRPDSHMKTPGHVPPPLQAMISLVSQKGY